jgi:hypothetical protein
VIAAAEPILARDPAAVRVTVVIPATKPSEQLGPVLASIAAQHHPAIECFVLGGERLAEAVAAYPLARHVPEFACDDNVAINRGWAMASGDYVAILPCVAPQPPHWLSTCVAWMEAHPWVIAGYPDWEEGGRTMRAPDWDLERMLTEAQLLPGPGALLRRRLIALDPLRDPAFGAAAEFMSWALLGLKGAVMRVPERVACGSRPRMACLNDCEGLVHAVATFFDQPDLPAPLRCWQPRATARAAENLLAAMSDPGASRADLLRAATLAIRLYGRMSARPLVKAIIPAPLLGMAKRAVIAAETANARVRLWHYHRSLRR